MPEIVPVPVADLLLDPGNPRLGDEQSSQQAIYLNLAQQQGKRLIALARDIVENGLDPTTLPAVIPTGDRRRRYIVLEGNRRVLALKALETPSVISGALSRADQNTLAALSVRYHEEPIDPIDCVLFKDAAEAQHWVHLRHTGANDGVGLVEWDANEVDRYRARHGRSTARSLGGQALDFVDRVDGPSASKAKIVTNLDRLMKSPIVRDRLGLRKDGPELASIYPAEEVLKGLRRIVSDLRSGAVKVNRIYYAEDQAAYVATFPARDLPSKKAALPDPVSLTALEPGKPAPKPKPKSTPKPKPKLDPAQRTTLIPTDCNLNPQTPRINAIYNELLTLNVNTHPNAAAVLMRVFVEVSLDHYVAEKKVTIKDQAKLFEKLKAVAQHLHDGGKIPKALKTAIDRIANTQKTVMSASTVTFNQYVHNYFVHAKPSELLMSWDELQPFMEKLWE